MKFEVYGNDEKNKTVKLKLSEDCCGEVTLKVVDEDGDTITNLLRVCNDGTISRCWGINSDLGFKLNNHGAIVIED